eukprot:15314231-Heterocapsa_arctica.AAC.1
MSIRRFWDPDGNERKIPCWADHLTHPICTLCHTKDYCNIWGIDRTCGYCEQARLVFAHEGLQLYDKKKDDLGRGPTVRDKKLHCTPRSAIGPSG